MQIIPKKTLIIIKFDRYNDFYIQTRVNYSMKEHLLYIERKEKIFYPINFTLFHITLHVISWCATYGPPCITLHQLDTRRNISKNKHYLIITTDIANLPASLLVVSMGKTFNGMPQSLWWWGKAVYPSWWPSLTKDMQTEHELIRMNE